MKKEFIAGITLGSALITSCNAIQNETDGPTPNYSTYTLPAEDYPDVIIPKFPDTLPTSIQLHQQQVVKVGRDNIALEDMPAEAVGQPEGNVLSERGSAVQVASNQYLTAGHILYRYDNKLKANASYCGNTFIYAATQIKNQLVELPEYKDRGPIYEGGAYLVRKHVGSYVKGVDQAVPDIALMEINDSNRIGKILQTKPVKIAAQQPALGDRLYAVNFEPTVQGKDRSPTQGDEYGLPVIYAQTPIATLPNGTLAVVEDLQSYGLTEEKSSRGGASGGAVFNEQGELVGITSGGGSGRKPIEGIEFLFKTDLINHPSTTEVTVSFIQPVTASMLGKLAVQLKSSPSCIN